MSAATLAERYEQLREDVLAGMALTARRWGFHLLLTRGLAAWMYAWNAMDCASPEGDLRSTTSATTHSGATNSPSGTDGKEASASAIPSTYASDIQLPAQFQRQITSLVVDIILQQSPMLA